MKLVSVNVGGPREIEWRGEIVRTSIFKSPVAGRVRVATVNLEGDQQSDLTVHGGRDKAVYVYPSEHYAFWREALADPGLPWGAFGENFTTEGLREDTVYVGDVLRCGSAAFTVTQPRIPCFKLGVRFNRPDMPKRFQQSGRMGFYLSVLREGEVGAGNACELHAVEGDRVSVAEIARLYFAKASERDVLLRVSQLPALPVSWRDYFLKRLGEEA